ncbi:MAG: hypothetical protein ABSH48_22675 [Verrucomicrobiota bacterium]
MNPSVLMTIDLLPTIAKLVGAELPKKQAGGGNPRMIDDGRKAPAHIPFETLLRFGVVLVVEGLDWSPK